MWHLPAKAVYWEKGKKKYMKHPLGSQSSLTNACAPQPRPGNDASTKVYKLAMTEAQLKRFIS